MALTAEQLKTANIPLNDADKIEQELTRLYGRRVHENSPFRTTQPIRKAHTLAEMEAFDKLRNRNRLWEPKKPTDADKEFVWKIVSFTTAVLGADEDDVRVQFHIQKCYRDQFIEVGRLVEVQGGEPNRETSQTNKPWQRHSKKSGDLKETGERMIDASDFVAEFKTVDDDE